MSPSSTGNFHFPSTSPFRKFDGNWKYGCSIKETLVGDWLSLCPTLLHTRPLLNLNSIECENDEEAFPVPLPYTVSHPWSPSGPITNAEKFVVSPDGQLISYFSFFWGGGGGGDGGRRWSGLWKFLAGWVSAGSTAPYCSRMHQLAYTKTW